MQEKLGEALTKTADQYKELRQKQMIMALMLGIGPPCPAPTTPTASIRSLRTVL